MKTPRYLVAGGLAAALLWTVRYVAFDPVPKSPTELQTGLKSEKVVHNEADVPLSTSSPLNPMNDPNRFLPPLGPQNADILPTNVATPLQPLPNPDQLVELLLNLPPPPPPTLNPDEEIARENARRSFEDYLNNSGINFEFAPVGTFGSAPLDFDDSK